MEREDPTLVFTNTDRGGCRRDGKGGSKILNGKVYFTPEGGLAVRFTAGEALSKGHVVYINQSSAADAVYKVPVDGDMPIGVAYEAAASGAAVWVVVSGIAHVMPAAAVTAGLGHVASVTATAGQDGRVASAASIPAIEFHLREVGHFVEAGSGAGALARCVLHFN